MKIIIGGQVDKKEVEALVQKYGPEGVITEIRSDLEAALALKTGTGDYYLGACHTGGGGALAMAIAILGASQCETVSMPGRQPTEQKIREAVQAGKKAFGFTADHKEMAVSMIMRAIQEFQKGVAG
ncbi:DUF2620 domain-containing protein [Paenactinomyces guangxiensis]|uniref:DUF2620 domain-containing protein n=1 Tax=Paenactinomyces guangxiensis TaxID=1490290 RepID=A0A7W2A7K5_9BACL|nr:DUF2620 domain-containing protein [Paenactinomyces guangxiensis]MBA4493219.1 DUF2620 domain-containing protein [Paenactinomyces guangxiensis]MBH8589931.1 DUF2620 domain-containing protein [Paenactinomyces guangxiensis]